MGDADVLHGAWNMFQQVGGEDVQRVCRGELRLHEEDGEDLGGVEGGQTGENILLVRLGSSEV